MSCYDLTDNKLLWEIEGDSICESGGKAYISHRDRSGVYMLEPKENTQPVLTEVGTRTRAVADAGDYVVCATTGYKSIIFVALYPDGTEVEIGVMEVSDPNRYGLSMMEIWNGKLFFAITSEDGLFCCDLI